MSELTKSQLQSENNNSFPNTFYYLNKNNFDYNVLYAYDSLVPISYKADLFRFCILYKYITILGLMNKQITCIGEYLISVYPSVHNNVCNCVQIDVIETIASYRYALRYKSTIVAQMTNKTIALRIANFRHHEMKMNSIWRLATSLDH